jgi:hypothetical protein
VWHSCSILLLHMSWVRLSYCLLHFNVLIRNIIILIIIISFMQGICTYIPETNYVAREYSVAAILLLPFMVLMSFVSVLNLLYFYINTFPSMCAVPNMAVYYYYSRIIIIIPELLLLLLLFPVGNVSWMLFQEGRSSNLRLRRGVGQAAHTRILTCTGV